MGRSSTSPVRVAEAQRRAFLAAFAGRLAADGVRAVPAAGSRRDSRGLVWRDRDGRNNTLLVTSSPRSDIVRIRLNVLLLRNRCPDNDDTRTDLAVTCDELTPALAARLVDALRRKEWLFCCTASPAARAIGGDCGLDIVPATFDVAATPAVAP